MQKDILTLNVLIYVLILGNTKTDNLLTLSKLPSKCLELLFFSTNIEIAILSTLTCHMFAGFV